MRYRSNLNSLNIYDEKILRFKSPVNVTSYLQTILFFTGVMSNNEFCFLQISQCFFFLDILFIAGFEIDCNHGLLSQHKEVALRVY